MSDQGQPVLAVAVYDIKGDPNRMVRFLMPLGLLLQPGVRYAVDQGKADTGRFAICLPNGCFAEGTINDAGVAAMKKAGAINISVQNQFAREVTFQVPLAGFGKAFDGAPIDPAVLEQQQKQLQEQMQKQADEMRKKLENPGWRRGSCACSQALIGFISNDKKRANMVRAFFAFSSRRAA